MYGPDRVQQNRTKGLPIDHSNLNLEPSRQVLNDDTTRRDGRGKEADQQLQTEYPKESNEYHHHHKRKLPYDAPRLHADSFFQYAPEFREWMKLNQGLYVSSMTGDEARIKFKLFAKAWNSGKLEDRYYARIEPTSISASSRSSYQWHFKNVDHTRLEHVRNQVTTATTLGKCQKTRLAYDEDDLLPWVDLERSKNDPLASKHDHDPMRNRDSSYTRPREGLTDRDHIKFKEHYGDNGRDVSQNRKREYTECKEALDLISSHSTGHAALIERKKMERAYRRTVQDDKQGDIQIDPYEVDGLMEQAKQQAISLKYKKEGHLQELRERSQAYESKEEALISSLRNMMKESKERKFN